MHHQAAMSPRERLARALAFEPMTPPRFESEFSDGVVRRWRNEGRLDEAAPEVFFKLDTFAWLPLEFCVERQSAPLVRTAEDWAAFEESYRAMEALPPPKAWNPAAWQDRAHPLAAAAWDEGFFQVLGIRDGGTLGESLTLLCEQPALAGAQMDFYSRYLEKTLDALLPGVDLDFALYYEPIASNHGPVISPGDYRRFALPALRRVVACLERHGVRHHVVWSAGQVRALVPLWLEAGINGLLLNRGAECGLRYTELRKAFGERLLFLGGIDWRAMMAGPKALNKELDMFVRPLMEQGGYVPFLDDTVREYVPFDTFQAYRARLDECLAQWTPP